MGRPLITRNRSSNPLSDHIASRKCWLLGRLPVITRNRDYLLDVDTGISNRVFCITRQLAGNRPDNEKQHSDVSVIALHQDYDPWQASRYIRAVAGFLPWLEGSGFLLGVLSDNFTNLHISYWQYNSIWACGGTRSAWNFKKAMHVSIDCSLDNNYTTWKEALKLWCKRLLALGRLLPSN